MYSPKPIYTFPDGSSTGIDQLPINSIIHVIDSDGAGTPRTITYTDDAGITSLTTITTLLAGSNYKESVITELDGILASSFLRSDTADTALGQIDFAQPPRFVATNGTAPFAVTQSTTKVANLNADLLDGFDSINITKHLGTLGDSVNLDSLATTADNGYYQVSSTNASTGSNMPETSEGGLLFNFYKSPLSYQTYQSFSTGRIFSRTGNGGFWNNWAEVAPTDSPELTTPTITGTIEKAVSLTGTNINVTTGNVFYKTISGATTLTVSAVGTTGNVISFILELTNPSTNVTWWSGIKWAGGTAPTLTTTGVDLIGFYTHDGGTTWRGSVLALDSK